MSGASEVPAIPEDVRLWWFLHILNACGKYGTYANDEPGEWVAAFCDDVEPKDTFNRACDLKLALCTHNSMDETSRVWITDAGKEWLARPVDTGREKALETGWFWTWDKLPEPGRKFIAVYNDGSGARMFFALDGSVVDHEGDEYGGFTESFDRWAYLPGDCEFWCETRLEEPFTFPPRALANPENGRG